MLIMQLRFTNCNKINRVDILLTMTHWDRLQKFLSNDSKSKHVRDELHPSNKVYQIIDHGPVD